jgi:hypothetical protein
MGGIFIKALVVFHLETCGDMLTPLYPVGFLCMKVSIPFPHSLHSRRSVVAHNF